MSMTTHHDLEEAVLLGALLLTFRPSEGALTRDRIFARNVTPSPHCTEAVLNTLATRGMIEVKDSSIAAKAIVHPSSNKNEIRIKGKSPSTYNRLLNDQLSTLAQKAFNPKDKVVIQRWVAQLLVAECMEYADFYAARNGLKFLCSDEYPARLEILLERRALGQVFMMIWRAVKTLSSSPLAENGIAFEIMVDKIIEYDFWYQQKSIRPDTYKRVSWHCQSLLSTLMMNKLLAISDDYTDLSPMVLRKHIDRLFEV